jgi:hypothetical protein
VGVGQLFHIFARDGVDAHARTLLVPVISVFVGVGVVVYSKGTGVKG